MNRTVSTEKQTAPLSYSTIGKNTVHWSFSKAKRFRERVVQNCPDFIETPSTLHKRSTSFGLGKRWEPRNPKGNDSPSPEKYSLPTCFDLEKRGAFFSVNLRDFHSKTMDANPGPGAYECLSESSMPAFSMTSRRPLSSDVTVPGPGAYSPNHSFSTKRYSVGNANRDTYKVSEVPGPASYFIESPRTKGAVFGLDKRKFVIENENNPGPGAYDTKLSWDGPKFSLRSKQEIKSALETPVKIM